MQARLLAIEDAQKTAQFYADVTSNSSQLPSLTMRLKCNYAIEHFIIYASICTEAWFTNRGNRICLLKHHTSGIIQNTLCFTQMSNFNCWLYKYHVHLDSTEFIYQHQVIIRPIVKVPPFLSPDLDLCHWSTYVLICRMWAFGWVPLSASLRVTAHLVPLHLWPRYLIRRVPQVRAEQSIHASNQSIFTYIYPPSSKWVKFASEFSTCRIRIIKVHLSLANVLHDSQDLCVVIRHINLILCFCMLKVLQLNMLNSLSVSYACGSSCSFHPTSCSFRQRRGHEPSDDNLFLLQRVVQTKIQIINSSWYHWCWIRCNG